MRGYAGTDKSSWYYPLPFENEMQRFAYPEGENCFFQEMKLTKLTLIASARVVERVATGMDRFVEDFITTTWTCCFRVQIPKH